MKAHRYSAPTDPAKCDAAKALAFVHGEGPDVDAEEVAAGLGISTERAATALMTLEGDGLIWVSK